MTAGIAPGTSDGPANDGDEDRTGELADLLRLDARVLLNAVGGRWSLLPRPWEWENDPLLHEPEPGIWFEAGHPVEVLLGLDGLGGAVVATPRLSWDANHLVVQPASVLSAPSALSGGDLAEWLRVAVADVTRRRRASFFSCRYCRTRHGPEYRHQGQVCMGCASRYLTVVF